MCTGFASTINSHGKAMKGTNNLRVRRKLNKPGPSDKLFPICGVPQGSFYNNDINDFSNCSTVFDFHLFPDDSNLMEMFRNSQSRIKKCP